MRNPATGGEVMRILVASLPVFALALMSTAPASASECLHNQHALGVSRILEINTSGGPRFGTLQYKQTLDLAPKEVVLTFDDGPHPKNTLRVLAALKKECVKATFFAVGTMVQSYPESLQAIADDGHTIGTHSWSHANIGRMSRARATNQIERGFRSINAAVDIQIAPFFRFPGLNDSKIMKSYATKRGYAIFSTDVSSDDWRGIGAKTIIRRTMSRLRQKKSGIILFHDTKYATATAIPALLQALKKGGYKIVHIVPERTYVSAENAKAEIDGVAEAAVVAKLESPGQSDGNPAITAAKR
jgi:peptidoglycan/xylan/chitin deacetylase (PgdA/CDA1 family)